MQLNSKTLLDNYITVKILNKHLKDAVQENNTTRVLHILSNNCITVDILNYCLTEAIKNNINIDIINILEKNGADLKMLHYSYLHYVCSTDNINNSNLEFFKKLIITHKLYINELHENRTCLMYAVIYNNINIVKLLLDNNANVNIRDNLNMSVFYFIHNLEIGKLLFTANNYMIINLESTTNNNHETPLLYEIKLKRDNLDIIKLLIENGANINVVDNTNRSVISYASDRFDIFEGFFEYLSKIKNINYFIKDDLNKTVYDYIIEPKYHNNSKNLIKFNVLTNNIFKCNPLIEACLLQNEKDVRQNLKYINQVDYNGNNAFYYVIKKNSMHYRTIIEILLNCPNFDLNFVNNKNETLFDLIELDKFNDMISMRLFIDNTYYLNKQKCIYLLKYLNKDVVHNIIYQYIQYGDVYKKL
jgi:ankyrin repeat protein